MPRKGRSRMLTGAIERQIVPINPHGGWDNRYIFWFGTGGYATPIYLMAWGSHMEDALEECIDWLADNAPGIFSDDHVLDEYNRLIGEGKDEEEAREEAEMDQSMWGHNGIHYIPSENWGIVKESPSRADILELQGRPAEHRARGIDALMKKARRYSRRR